jgi:hypothetical protein
MPRFSIGWSFLRQKYMGVFFQAAATSRRAKALMSSQPTQHSFDLAPGRPPALPEEEASACAASLVGASQPQAGSQSSSRVDIDLVNSAKAYTACCAVRRSREGHV